MWSATGTSTSSSSVRQNTQVRAGASSTSFASGDLSQLVSSSRFFSTKARSVKSGSVGSRREVAALRGGGKREGRGAERDGQARAGRAPPQDAREAPTAGAHRFRARYHSPGTRRTSFFSTPGASELSGFTETLGSVNLPRTVKSIASRPSPSGPRNRPPMIGILPGSALSP